MARFKDIVVTDSVKDGSNRMLEDDAAEYINCFNINQEKLRALLEIDLEKKKQKLSKATSENEAMHALIKLQEQ